MTASVSPAAAVGTAVASVVLPAGDLDATLAYFVDQLGFRLLSVSPADAPRVATIEGHGLRVQLDRDAGGAPGHLRLPIDGPGIVPTTDEVMAPNGTAVELVPTTSRSRSPRCSRHWW